MTDISITALFEDAHGQGAIGSDSKNLLSGMDLNDQLAQAMGIDVDTVNATELTLVTMVVDNSPSMEPMEDEARQGHTLMIDALKGSKQSDGVLLGTWTFDDDPIGSYQPLSHVTTLNRTNYRADYPQGTPLFTATIKALGGVVAKTQQFSDNGQPTRSVTVIITDGANNGHRNTAQEVATLVHDLEKQEMHVVIFIGIEDSSWPVDFRQVAQEMGIRPDRVLTVNDGPHALRAAIRMASQSALAVSQAVGTVSQVGFGAVGV